MSVQTSKSAGEICTPSLLSSVCIIGSEDYSKEELVAEITSAAIMNHIGLETLATFNNSAAYIQNWLKALKNDKKLIVSASGKAEKAARYILNINDEKG